VRHYFTSCDARYLPRLQVLHESMRRHCEPFTLHVLALGELAAAWCASRHDVKAIPVDHLLDRFPELAIDRMPGPPRYRVDEQLCTWRWWAALELLTTYGRDSLTCIDADAMFWSSPEAMLAELDAGAAGFGVMPHAMATAADGAPGITVEDHGHFGLYNGGFVYLRDVPQAALLARYVWEWCYAGWRKHPDGRSTYGDQGYLELILERHPGAVISDPGFITAPWNLNVHELELDGAGVRVDGRPLVWFHYLGYTHEQRAYVSYATTKEHDRILYEPYRRRLRAAELELGFVNPPVFAPGEKIPGPPCRACGERPRPGKMCGQCGRRAARA